MRLQRDSYAPKSCAFDAANVQFLRAHLCKSHPVLQQMGLSREENLLDLTPHDHGMECGSGRLFAFVALRAWRESALNYGAPRTKSRWLTATYFG